ncbi:hypothetical protein A6V36_18035 [Paraburkholderia ginsengiterrae]|uniref:Histidine kinase n=1 Tax=Paraburkholderia ginsengiterrae TaxID=1462993 RepID=A0A1A9MXG0_9BURK|nr:histidine kinase [Paraburkholderia ginsengiterrae]OAJ52033.1 hypothetical protein A6V37_10215 [Paraburkholderia ginsengiterrae]OAJ63394.1 hypothetical protein A6V36_18035 [Paraburkholderia ginsengiterrae]
MTAHIGTIATSFEQLDLATVIQLSQAVSGELVFEKLIDTLMRTALMQAGAGRALLILAQTAGERIAAEAIADGDTVTVQLCKHALAATALPESILRHVLSSQACLLLDDALAEGTFVEDPYIRQHRARSVLGLPLLTQAKLIGVLYLENNLAPRVFSPARLAVLKLLTSQAAIAMENIRLCQRLTEREAKIRRLVDTNIVGIFIYDLDGCIHVANDAFLHIVGYDREDLASGCINWKHLTPQEWLDRDLRELIPGLRKTGFLPPFEKEYIRKDGSRVPIMLTTATFDETEKEGVAFVVDLTGQRKAEHRLRESYEMLRELASRRETAREEERKHIARELHDELGQHLTALRMRASTLRMQLKNDRPALVDETGSLIALVDQTMQVVRSVITSLRPPVLDMGIAAALEWLTAEFNRNGRTMCHLRMRDENMAMSEDHAIVLFRVVQEALTNVTRHADATEVIITLERTTNAYLLEVLDDGQGFDVQATRNRSFGLAGMEERVLMLGGQIDVMSSPGIGTLVKVDLPAHRSTRIVVPRPSLTETSVASTG